MKSKKIYIFPTHQGFIFLLGTAIVILVGATYNNNLVFLLGFFLFSIFIVSMVETHNNLRGLDIEVVSLMDHYAGQPISIPIRLVNNESVSRQMVEYYPANSKLSYGEIAWVEEIKSQMHLLTHLICAPLNRGVHPIPRIVLSTVYPLGLFRSWMMIHPEGEILIYPHPEGSLPLKPMAHENSNLSHLPLSGHQRGDEFREHRKYNAGESYHRLDWKVYARRRRLMIKEFEGTTDKKFSLRFNDIHHRNEESVLSQLSRWLEMVKDRGAPFELVLPMKKIPFGQGLGHFQKCQRELARFQVTRHEMG